MIGSCLMLGLKSETLSEEEQFILTHYKVAGVILFKRNLKNFQQIHSLCQDIKSLSFKTQEEAPLIAIDMEGGSVNRFSHIKESLPWPSAKILSQKSSDEIFAVAKTLGERLRFLGFDINFAPVVDLPSVKSSLLEGRTFGEDSQQIVERASSFIKGLQEGGVIPCLKHFPGHGAVKEDSHKTLPKDFRSLEELGPQIEIFKTLFQNKPICIMTAHIEFPCIEKTPASFSKVLLNEELKKRRGFSGLLISDDISMSALDGFSIVERVVKAIQGGCDLILHCQEAKTCLEVFKYFESHSEIQRELEPLMQASYEKLLGIKRERKNFFPLKSWEETSKKLSFPKSQELFKSLDFL